MRITGKDYKGIDEARYIRSQLLADTRTLDELEEALNYAKIEAKQAKQEGCSHVFMDILFNEITPLKMKIELRRSNNALAADQNPPRDNSAANINSVSAAAFGS